MKVDAHGIAVGVATRAPFLAEKIGFDELVKVIQRSAEAAGEGSAEQLATEICRELHVELLRAEPQSAGDSA